MTNPGVSFKTVRNTTNSIIMSPGCSIPVNTKHMYNNLYNVEPTSKTLVRRYTNGIQMFCVCWDLGVAEVSLFDQLHTRLV